MDEVLRYKRKRAANCLHNLSVRFGEIQDPGPSLQSKLESTMGCDGYILVGGGNVCQHSVRRRRRGRNEIGASQKHRRMIIQPHRKLTINQVARISLLSSFIILVASSNNDVNIIIPKEERKECKAPRVAVNLNFLKAPNSWPSNLPAAISPRDLDNPQLGDGIRSSEASGVFFDSLDRDGDGAIEPEEVAAFLQNEIGGKQFDTKIEIDEEVDTIMERLDQNHNNGLEMSDMLDYWIQLESLLTAEEVAEWIVYSVQLPSSVGKIFLENGITGYDFLEIVDNGGEVLQNELGIDKASFRNKIVRQMQARMLGIGSSPGNPQKFTYKLESCKAATLSWERSTARVFPVHSYRIQRRSINLFGGNGSSAENEVGISTNSNVVAFDSSNNDWKTIYVGADNEFVDSGLETGHNYMYRIQAWNSAGRSGWETIDLTKSLKKQKCSTKPSPKLVFSSDRGGIHVPLSENETWEWMSTPKRICWAIIAFVQFLYHSVRFFFALVAILAGIMRYKRATATSSSSATVVLPFPRFWRGLNKLSVKLTGQEAIPKTMLGDREALARQATLHDQQINATGLRGYDRLRKTTRDQSQGSRDKSQESDQTKKKKTKEDPFDFGSDRRSALKKVKSHSTGDLTASTVTFGNLPREVVVPQGGGTPNKFAWMRPGAATKRAIGGTTSFGGISETSEASSMSPSGDDTRSRASAKSAKSTFPEHPRRATYVDDGTRCSECEKKFKIGKRYKHHCARCMATFCHKHGRTTHNNFTSCKVPGDCICNTCLKVVSSRSTEASDRSRTFSR